MNFTTVFTLLLLAIAIASPTPAIPATGLMQGVALPQPRTEGVVTYMSGGAGKAESAAMNVEAKHYPLSLFFSSGNGSEYLADVHVTIKDRTGKDVLSAVSEGPVMLVKIPEGKYTVVADANGKALHDTVKITATNRERLSFHWPRV